MMATGGPGVGTQPRTRILIVDDHAIVRRGLAQLLNGEHDLEVCAEAGTAPEAIRVAATAHPDLAIVDVSLRDESGLELIRDFRAQYPDMPVLVLSMHDERYYAQRALRTGAMGYIMKEEAPDTIIEAIRRVLSGRVYVSAHIADSMLAQLAGRKNDVSESPVTQLSNRELQVLQLIGKGLGTREVASRLNLSVKTVDNHRDRIKAKLGLKNANALVQFAIRWTLEGSA